MKLMHEVRGLRNANPGNLEKSSTISWDGQVYELPGVPDEPRFCQFINMDYGIRAIYRILYTYDKKYQIDTIKKIINRWAPPLENATDDYINSVAAGMETAPNVPLEKQIYPTLVKYIIKHENGFCPFTIEYIKAVFVWAVPEWQS